MTTDPPDRTETEQVTVVVDEASPTGLTEDWCAVLLGGLILAIAFAAVYSKRPDSPAAEKFPNPLKAYVSKPGSWSSSPLQSLVPQEEDGQPNYDTLIGTLAVLAVGVVFFGAGQVAMGQSFGRFAPGFVVVFLLATLSYLMAGQSAIKLFHLGYPLWAMLLGLLISNTIGTPESIKAAVSTEFYIKTGLVLLGAEVLFGKLLILGKPGIVVAWVVTPIVLVSTYLFGQKVLKMASRSLNITISADMSVCGVSAAIATAAACRARKEELTLAVGLSMAFTVVMMVAMPAFIQAVGMDKLLGAAWMGGTIDATGAVAAAGEFLGEEYLPVAATVKMIQNILIGVIAFCVSVYWTVFVDRENTGAKPSLWEIWRRFPKFILGFVAASLIFSAIHEAMPGGEKIVDSVIGGTTKTLRGWFFCLAFVSIGLDTNFRELAQSLQGGKPLLLYVVGQSFNLCLTLFMAWLMFIVVYPEVAAKLTE